MTSFIKNSINLLALALNIFLITDSYVLNIIMISPTLQIGHGYVIFPDKATITPIHMSANDPITKANNTNTIITNFFVQIIQQECSKHRTLLNLTKSTTDRSFVLIVFLHIGLTFMP